MSKKQWVWTKHHRKPSSIGGKTEDRNISVIPSHLHQAWHILFRNFTPEVICDIINRAYLDPDYEMVVQKKQGQEF